MFCGLERLSSILGLKAAKAWDSATNIHWQGGSGRAIIEAHSKYSPNKNPVKPDGHV